MAGTARSLRGAGAARPHAVSRGASSPRARHLTVVAGVRACIGPAIWRSAAHAALEIKRWPVGCGYVAAGAGPVSHPGKAK